MMGFAAFTKNAALIGIPLLALWLVGAGWWRGWAGWRAALIGLAACALIAAPWYIRNLIGAGFLIPATAWTDQAERSLRTLAIYLTLPDNFAVTGWLVAAGLGWVGMRLLRDLHGGRAPDAAELALVWFTLPFFAAWWLFVSYDPRFIMLFTPVLCAAAGAMLVWLSGRVEWRRMRFWLVTAACVGALAMAWIAVEHKTAILRDPFMSGADKIALVRGGR
jgi:MFS family permease